MTKYHFDIDMKTCTKCHTPKRLTAFHPRRLPSGRLTLTADCKICRTAATRARYLPTGRPRGRPRKRMEGINNVTV
jgi:hypothetical protein